MNIPHTSIGRPFLFESLPNETIINISQYLTIHEMNTLSGLTNALAKRFLCHNMNNVNDFGHFMLTQENKENAPFFSSISSIPFIAYNLFRRNHLTSHEFVTLESGIRENFICNHKISDEMLSTCSIMHLTSSMVMCLTSKSIPHLTNTCPQSPLLIENILSIFCSKITRLDWRECFCENNIFGEVLVNEHGHTPFRPQVLHQYFKKFPNITILKLRGYQLSTQSFNFLESMYAKNPTFSYTQSDRDSTQHTWIVPRYKPRGWILGKMYETSNKTYYSQQISQLKASSFKDYVVSGTDLPPLKIFVKDLSAYMDFVAG